MMCNMGARGVPLLLLILAAAPGCISAPECSRGRRWATARWTCGGSRWLLRLGGGSDEEGVADGARWMGSRDQPILRGREDWDVQGSGPDGGSSAQNAHDASLDFVCDGYDMWSDDDSGVEVERGRGGGAGVAGMRDGASSGKRPGSKSSTVGKGVRVVRERELWTKRISKHSFEDDYITLQKGSESRAAKSTMHAHECAHGKPWHPVIPPSVHAYAYTNI